MTAAALAAVAFDRYALECSRLVKRGEQEPLFDSAFAVVREWRGIWLACEAEAVRVGR